MSDDSMKKYSSKQEKLVADTLGGYVIGGSGAMPTAPGDVKTYDWLVECKTHATPDHPIFFDIDVWKKICNEAMATHRKPVLIVDDGSQRVENTWCLCRSANLNLGSTLLVDFPAAIRKNISCKDAKLKNVMHKAVKGFVGDFYKASAYEVNWDGEDVCILQLDMFKELFDL